MSEEEIKEAIGWLSALDAGSEYGAISKEIILSRLEQLEEENKELKSKKYIASLSCDGECNICEHFKNEYLLKKELEPIRELGIPVKTVVAELNRLEDLEDDREQLKQENKELKRVHINIQGMRNGKELLNKYIKDSIPKSVIREKIEELENYIQENSDKQGYWGNKNADEIYNRIDILEELLGE